METGPSTSAISPRCALTAVANSQQLLDRSTELAATQDTPPVDMSAAPRTPMCQSAPANIGIVIGKTDPAMAPYSCARCNMNIVDRYLLEALDKYWHEDCLKCDACGGRLCELGSKLYFKNNSILCQRDYLRIFRPNGTCAACARSIPAFEQVMKAGSNVYHLECFACQQCHQSFNSLAQLKRQISQQGDEFEEVQPVP